MQAVSIQDDRTAVPARRRARVLLVAERGLFQRALRQGLVEEGYDVELATATGCDGSGPPDHDAVVLDVRRPRDPGMAVLSAWRRAGLCSPVIVLTLPVAGGLTPACPAEADEQLIKPFPLEELLGRLRRLVPAARR